MTIIIVYLYVRIQTINLRDSESDSGLSNAKRDLLIQAISLEEQGTAYPSGAPEFTPGFQWGLCYFIFSFRCVLEIVFCPFVPFLLAIVLSVLRYTDSDDHFGIFNLFLLFCATMMMSYFNQISQLVQLMLWCYYPEITVRRKLPRSTRLFYSDSKPICSYFYSLI